MSTHSRSSTLAPPPSKPTQLATAQQSVERLQQQVSAGGGELSALRGRVEQLDRELAEARAAAEGAQVGGWVWGVCGMGLGVRICVFGRGVNKGCHSACIRVVFAAARGVSRLWRLGIMAVQRSQFVKLSPHCYVAHSLSNMSVHPMPMPCASPPGG